METLRSLWYLASTLLLLNPLDTTASRYLAPKSAVPPAQQESGEVTPHSAVSLRQIEASLPLSVCLSFSACDPNRGKRSNAHRPVPGIPPNSFLSFDPWQQLLRFTLPLSGLAEL